MIDCVVRSRTASPVKKKTADRHTPNAETIKVLKDADCGIGIEPTSLEQLRKEWDKACVK